MGRRKLTFNEFKMNMIEKYGDSFFNEFEKLKKNPYYTLSDIARKYGVTRSRIGQIYERINNINYRKKQTPINKEKRMEEVSFSCINHPINFKIKFEKSNNIRQILNSEAKLQFHEKCKKLGLDPKYDKHNYLVTINNKTIKIHTGNVGKNKYFTIEINKGIDIDACLCRSLNSWFIIPKEEFKDKKKTSFIYIKNNGKYDKYKENWQILTNNH